MAVFSRQGNEDPIITVCRMVNDTKYEDFPESVVTRAKQSILDTMAVIVGGSSMDGISAVVDLVKEKGGKPESVIPFYGGKVPASEAGLAIGPMARAMDCGEVHEEAGHCSEYILPVLLAATGLKNRVNGKEFITAYILGMEVLIRIGLAFKGVSRGVPMGRSMGHFIFGCVAATGKLLGLSRNELENAEGIARAMTQPHDFAMANEGRLMVRVHHGFVCQDAINACLLAKKGVTGARREVLLGKRGYLGFAKWETEPDALTRELGQRWEMVNTMMKLYTACRCTHSAVDALLDLVKQHNIATQDIAHIDIAESSQNWVLVCEPWEAKLNPETVPECQFSLPFVVATAMYDKDVFLNSYTPQARARPGIRDLITKISARHEPTLGTFAAVVTVTLKDGRKCSKECDNAKGHPSNPLTEAELVNKFKKCVPFSAYKLNRSVVDSVITAILKIEEVDNVMRDLLLPLTPN